MEKTATPTVYIVDDDAGMRKSLSMLMASESLAAITFASAEEFLADAKPAHPSCVVLDLRMPGMGGIELLQQLRRQLVDIPVILISAHADVPVAVRGMKLGAVDLLQKPVEPEALIAAVKSSLHQSEIVCCQQTEARQIGKRFERLTTRELELLKLVTDGLSNKQVAVEMGISVKTVANHRANLMVKTSASNAADLSRLFTIFTAQQTKPTPGSGK